MQIITDFPL